MDTYNLQHTTKNLGENASVKGYKGLIVYQKAKTLTIDLIKFYSEKKLGWTEKYLIDQLLRAASSVGANLAEGYGRLYKLDYRRFISISRGSSFEVEYWIDLISNVRPQDLVFLEKNAQINIEVLKMLTAMMKSLKS
jgi:four helix bundle protein